MAETKVEMRVKDTSEVFEADHICIASGGKPRIGGFEGADLCMDRNIILKVS